MSNATDRQVNGDHYTRGTIQPIEYIHANDMDFMTGNIIKYATRWPYKGSALSDLRKVIHYAELLIEAEGLDMECNNEEPTEQMCGACDCEQGECLASEWENQEAYKQWQDETNISRLKYETR